ncbi:dTDP-4-dehydrorhamnose 3,5-epimerase [Methylobacterium sp. 4-46]|uniref:dTDP-4-dehydrorhamnose 3,5-epimerase family protein n=1 Tax=unclassified Methylobacterium TaxID=2615210 RepID=UPI000152D610|nr:MULTISPECIES: dTDP-4-dehydrorhamnose 3,5-epimerase family protein [Methylobacterium]ACA19316.1 dTDP-4-dehydrorhamnose 3,5-epimerase [Methylobacterium sp. 4-46]WFT78518.1 dTDP-4-dehydrorhamnose 3,5-epimerase family protein [Methylobacterium nodulans]
MIVSETDLSGVYIVDIDPRRDERGHFARIFCTQELAERGLIHHIPQISLSYNIKRGTLRGMHFKYPPYSETKYVRCVRGRIFDVVVDLRPESRTYLGHLCAELSAENGRCLYIPERCAHGFITLEDDSEVMYMISAPHAPDGEGGLVHDDPRLAIPWPIPVEVISRRDAEWPALAEVEDAVRSRMALRGPEPRPIASQSDAALGR